MIGLGDLPGGNFDSQAYGVSSDGRVVVGHCDSDAWSTEAMRWSAETGMVSLGIAGRAVGASEDGSVIVGWELVAAGIHRAFIWDENNGVRPLQQLLELEFGLDLTGWDLTSAHDVSADGLTIVGNGTNPSGNHEGWLARIEFGCSDGMDNDSDGFIDYPDDPGCADGDDLSERSPDLVCDDGLDNDEDGLVDYPNDPGCTDALDPSEEQSDCEDDLDNDGDGLTDYPDDPGCANFWDASEKDDTGMYPCDDGIDNEIPPDGFVDFRTDGSGDPGCFNPYYFAEKPQCQDGFNNDFTQDSLIDFDGGASAGVPPEWQTAPDPQCIGKPWKHNERCGVGAELALLLPPLMWLWGRRGRRTL